MWRDVLSSRIVLGFMAVACLLLGGCSDSAPDFTGGAKLIFDVETPQSESAENKVDMELLCQRLRKRLDPDESKQIVVRPSEATQQVEVLVTREERAELDEIKQRILDLGTLEFLVVCNLRDHETREFGHISEAGKLADDVNDLRDADNVVVARWVPISKHRPELAQQCQPPGTGQLVNDFGYATRLVTLADGSKQIQVLCKIHEDLTVNGNNLTRVTKGVDYDTGKPSINFSLDEIGARHLQELTRKHLSSGSQPRRHLAIILNGSVDAAPTINSVISDRGQITGYDSKKERDAIIAVLLAGQLGADLKFVKIVEQ